MIAVPGREEVNAVSSSPLYQKLVDAMAEAILEAALTLPETLQNEEAAYFAAHAALLSVLEARDTIPCANVVHDDAYAGTRVGSAPCPACGGSGIQKCETCAHTLRPGFVGVSYPTDYGTGAEHDWASCPDCGGDGTARGTRLIDALLGEERGCSLPDCPITEPHYHVDTLDGVDMHTEFVERQETGE